MIKVKISQIYNGQPYYTISKNGKDYSALGAEQAFGLIKRMRNKRGRIEKIEFVGIDSILQQHNKLVQSIENER